jgi:hypothetical protein
MTRSGDKTIKPLATGGAEFVWPPPIKNIRSLTDLEIAELERTLDKPVDRKYLVHWISQSIADVVRLSSPGPSARQYRDELVQIARKGRGWLKHIDQCAAASLISKHAELSDLKTTVAQFCDRVDSIAKQVSISIKAGHPRAPFPLEAFLKRMIGIAKRAKVLPSTPSRGERTGRRPNPAFFHFVVTALEIARDVIKSSSLTDPQQRAALKALRVQSDQALVKVLEGLRGRISDYHESAHGLVAGKIQ